MIKQTQAKGTKWVKSVEKISLTIIYKRNNNHYKFYRLLTDYLKYFYLILYLKYQNI